MKERNMTIDIVKANVFSILLLIGTGALSLWLWYMLWYEPTDTAAESVSALRGNFYFLVLIVAGIPVHELIHGLTWARYANTGWKSIKFGIMMKMLTPYCHCKEPLKVHHYIIGALMPLTVLGILPLIVGLCVGNGLTIAFGVIMITAACGDIMIAWKLRHELPETMVLDHPSEAGCILYEEEKSEKQ